LLGTRAKGQCLPVAASHQGSPRLSSPMSRGRSTDGRGPGNRGGQGNHHHACWWAPPGSGKDDAGKAVLPGLLPPFRARKPWSLTQVYSVGGCCGPTRPGAQRPFPLAPPQLHGSSPDRGGRFPGPVNCHWAHPRAVSFDELTEFSREGGLDQAAPPGGKGEVLIQPQPRAQPLPLPCGLVAATIPAPAVFGDHAAGLPFCGEAPQAALLVKAVWAPARSDRPQVVMRTPGSNDCWARQP